MMEKIICFGRDSAKKKRSLLERESLLIVCYERNIFNQIYWKKKVFQKNMNLLVDWNKGIIERKNSKNPLL